MRRMWLACAGVVLLASDSGAVSLTITPDEPVYEVGETITLTVFGEFEPSALPQAFGSLLFDVGLARHLASSQAPYAFPVVGPLTASVMLEALAPGTLEIAWGTTGSDRLDFFFLQDAPGTRVTIVPEPEAGMRLAFALGLILAVQRRARCR